MSFSILIMLLFSQIGFAQNSTDCFSCEPLAEVSITNQGLARLVETSMKQNFIELNKTIRSRAGFRDLVLDRSQCKSQSISEAFKDRNNADPTNCLGMPDLSSDDGMVSKQTRLRPFKAKMTDLKLNQLDLELVTPLQCENFTCQIQVKLKRLDLEGNLGVNYTDKDETFIPKTKLRLNNTQNSDVRLAAEAYLDPKTGKLEDLIFLSPDKTNLNLKPGSFNFDMDFKKYFDSPEKEASLHGKYFKKQMAPIQSKLSSAKYLQEQVDRYVDQKVFREWALSSDRNISQESIRKKVEASVFADYGGSKEALLQKLSQTAWPDFSNDEQINSFMKNPPPEMQFVRDVTDRIDAAHISAVAENAGFSNRQGFEFALIGVYAANQMQDSPQIVDQLLQPFLKKEIVPMVEAQVNQELRNLKNYWDQISEIPSLNIQNLKILSDLKDHLAQAKTPDERKKIEDQIKVMNAKINADWIPIDTAVFVDQNLRSQKIMRAQIASNNPACNSAPRTFSSDQDDDFDLRTNLGTKALQEYFNSMAAHKKLDFCLSNSPKSIPPECDGGTSIKFTKPPKLTCDNGQIIFDLDTEAQKSLFKAGLQGQVRAEVKNCDGNPCVQLTDSKGNFKNAFLNTFFGSALQRSLSLATNSSTNQPISIPNVRLKKLQTDPKNCSTKLDWDIQP